MLDIFLCGVVSVGTVEMLLLFSHIVHSSGSSTSRQLWACDDIEGTLPDLIRMKVIDILFFQNCLLDDLLRVENHFVG